MSDKQPRFKFASKIVVASVCAVVFYTLFVFYLQLRNLETGMNVQVPTDITALWFAFWTVELVCLASIRKTKIKNKYEYEDQDRKMSQFDYIRRLKQTLDMLDESDEGAGTLTVSSADTDLPEIDVSAQQNTNDDSQYDNSQYV